MSTPHPYCPMPDGASIIYQVQAITGIWNAVNGFLDVSTRTPHNVQEISYSPIVTASGNFTAEFFEAPETPNTPINPATTLCDCMAILPNGLHYLGEAKNQLGQVVWPPEMKLTLNPFAGQLVEGVSAVYPNDTSQTAITQNFRWTYRTLAHYPMYGPFADCWRTSLYEPGNKAAYNYVFQQGVGPVCFWYGIVTSGNVAGYEYFMIDKIGLPV